MCVSLILENPPDTLKVLTFLICGAGALTDTFFVSGFRDAFFGFFGIWRR
jgi:hypothetical protein